MKFYFHIIFLRERLSAIALKFDVLINMFALHLYTQDPDKGTQLHLGINHCGILTFQDSRKVQHFRWSEVQKINFEGKMFIVHVTINEVSEREFAYCQSG